MLTEVNSLLPRRAVRMIPAVVGYSLIEPFDQQVIDMLLSVWQTSG